MRHRSCRRTRRIAERNESPGPAETRRNPAPAMPLNYGRTVYVVDGRRTPILKASGSPGPFSASDLAVACSRDLILRYPEVREGIQELVWGCVMPSESEANISRIIGLRLGLDLSVPAHTVQRNCASGMQALDAAAQRIAQGASDLILAGGVEAMSRAPVLLGPEAVSWLGRFSQARGRWARLRAVLGFRPRMLNPISALKCGLTDPVVDLNMGQTAEELAYRFRISRRAMDTFALESHELAARAQDAGVFDDEITPLYDGSTGEAYVQDTGVRRDSSLDQLGRLRPAFDSPNGNVTAGNSAQISDGAAALLLASEEAIEKYRLPVLGILHHINWAALDPVVMGLGPVHAMRDLFDQAEVTVAETDCFEINEAFAVQVLACLAAWQDETYMREVLGRTDCLAPIDKERLNPHGGAVAIGHPVGMTGARIVLHVLKQLKRMKGRFGVASLCIGGGQGGAALLEHVS